MDALESRLAAPELMSAPVLEREWLVTDGAGGYASSTVPSCPARRYHGLLVAPFPGTAERYVFLSRFDESLRVGSVETPLSVARYGDTYAPRGDEHLVRFAAEPDPVFDYAVDGARLRREIRMVRGEHTVLVRYSLVGGTTPVELEAGPLTPFRRADHLTIENDALDTRVSRLENGIAVQPYAALPVLAITSSKPARFHERPTWYRGITFPSDEARGYEGHEDQFRPGIFEVRLAPGDSIVFAASIERPIDDPARAWQQAAPRRTSSTDPLERQLEHAADDFLQRTPDGRLGIVAGFPWFLEWGRDTFLSLPGLTIARGRNDLCAEVLTQVRPFLWKGLLPNIFGTSVADSHYGSADAALWFARAVLLFDRAGGDRGLVRGELRRALEAIAEAYFAGTDLGLFVDDAGLLHAGTPAHNPTWMDAQTSAGPVTPRHGCPVEIAALWCSMLAHLEELAPSRTDQRHWREAKQRAQTAFLDRLWLEDEGRLADRWLDGEQDRSIRPNMLFAAALELSPLGRAQRSKIVRTAERELVTPVGLRTLARGDVDYVGRYEGGPEERDGAYHQGTVWPWLFGAFVEASLRAEPPTRALRSRLKRLVDGLSRELDCAGIGHVSEVFDGDAPHRPGGTVAQAWNTAEWLRARWLLAGGFR